MFERAGAPRRVLKSVPKIAAHRKRLSGEGKQLTYDWRQKVARTDRPRELTGYHAACDLPLRDLSEPPHTAGTTSRPGVPASALTGLRVMSACDRLCPVFFARVLKTGTLAIGIAMLRSRVGHAQPQQVSHDYSIHNFAFADGESLPELRLHYVTLGSPSRDANGVVRNAVLILHVTTGSGAAFLRPAFAGELFGPGKALDTSRFYVILPDGIVHGRSSKPSDGMHAHFPRYAYDDMVNAQHRLVSEGLGVNHLRLVIGTSMGCMHAWIWGERFPEFVDGLVPLACVPAQIAGRNRMMRKIVIDAIRTDPAWNGGEYSSPPVQAMRTAAAMAFVMGSSSIQLQRAAPTRDAADSLITKTIDEGIRGIDANDLLYALEASRDYDPSLELGSIRAAVLAINSADDVVNPPELGLMETLMPRVKRGRYVLIPISDQTRGHGTHSLPAIWKEYLGEFLRELPQ